MHTSRSSKHRRSGNFASRGLTRLTAVAVGAVLVVGILLPATVRADTQDNIDYRQHIMKTMEDQMTAINLILRKQAPADSLPALTQALAVSARTANSAFKPQAEGGASKPDVWTHWADFSKRLDNLVAGTDALAKAAKTGGIAAAAPKVAALNCKSCHAVYMKAKK